MIEHGHTLKSVVKTMRSFSSKAPLSIRFYRSQTYFQTVSSPIVTRRYFETCKSHVTSEGRDGKRPFLLGGRAGES
jgi:hypothetical protein